MAGFFGSKAKKDNASPGTDEDNNTIIGPFELDRREQKEMKALFCISKDKDRKKPKDSKKSKLATSTSSKKKQLVQLLEMTRANNISIVLARFGSVTFERILHLMSSFNTDNISGENFRSLLSLAPTAAELETLKAYTGPTDAKSLGKAERFCLAIGSIPRYASRIRCFLYSLKFDEVSGDIELDLDLLHETANRVRNAKSLHGALSILLALGNFLNEGASNGDADGVSVDALNKLKNVKSYGTKTTALHYFAIVVQSRAQHVLKLSEECGDCRGASSVVLSQIQSDFKLLQRGYEMLLAEVEKVQADVDNCKVGDPGFNEPAHKLSLLFLKTSEDISEQYSVRLGELSDKLEATNKAYKDMLTFYGELETKNPSDFFSSIADFIVEFENAQKDNEESRQRAKKRAAAKKRAEDMREKSKSRGTRKGNTSKKRKGALGSVPQSKHSRGANKTSGSGKIGKAIALPPNLPPSILPSKKMVAYQAMKTPRIQLMIPAQVHLHSRIFVGSLNCQFWRKELTDHVFPLYFSLIINCELIKLNVIEL